MTTDQNGKESKLTGLLISLSASIIVGMASSYMTAQVTLAKLQQTTDSHERRLNEHDLLIRNVVAAVGSIPGLQRDLQSVIDDRRETKHEWALWRDQINVQLARIDENVQMLKKQGAKP